MPQPTQRLTPHMRAALEEAARRIEGLRRTFDDKPGKPPWPFAPATLAALVKHSLLEPREIRHRKGWRVQAWFITDAGREALKPVLVVKRDRPLYLAPQGGYTSNPKRSIDYDERTNMNGKPVLVAVEAVKGAPSPEWARRAEGHRRIARADVNAARLSGLTSPEERLAELKWLASQRGVDVASELRRVDITRKAHERALGALERRVRDDQRAA